MNEFHRRLVGPWVPHEPTDRQEHALCALDVREILYGGAAGGGKTDWLLMEALRFVDVPGYSALLLRRTYPELWQAGGLIPRSTEWLATTDAVWSSKKNEWTFPSGATLAFGHMQREVDRFNYQGGEYQLIGFDELTHFTESQYRYMFSRLRKPKALKAVSKLPLRVRTASNPGGIGHDWVKSRLVLGHVEEGVEPPLFVSAKLADNPYIDRVDYTQSLMHLLPHEREQLLNGNWEARPPGALFSRAWFDVQERRSLRGQRRLRAWDIAATPDGDYSVGLLMSCDENKACVVEDVVRGKWSPSELDQVVRATAQADGREVPIWIEEQPGAAGKIANTHFRNLLAGHAVRFDRPTGSKYVRANPVASHAEAGGLSVVQGPWLPDFFAELEMYTGTKEDPHDDQVDALSLAFSRLVLKRGMTPGDLYSPPVEEAA